VSPKRLLLLLAAVAALVALWSWWHSDRRRIERRVDELQELVSKSGEESAIQGLGRARAVTGLFAPAFEIRARQLGFTTGDTQELIRFVHGYRSRAEAIRMRVSTESLSVVAEHRRATQIAALEFLTGGPLGTGSEIYRVQINWMLERGEWLIDYVDLIEIADPSAP
jgi:hypothetical protein